MCRAQQNPLSSHSWQATTFQNRGHHGRSRAHFAHVKNIAKKKIDQAVEKTIALVGLKKPMSLWFCQQLLVVKRRDHSCGGGKKGKVIGYKELLEHKDVNVTFIFLSKGWSQPTSFPTGLTVWCITGVVSAVCLAYLKILIYSQLQ